MQYFERMTIEQLSENVTGVMHNLKSALMAVNGYVDLLAPENTGELYEQAKRSTASIERIVDNLVFAMRAYCNTEPTELSLNDCVRSTVELLRSNQTFRSKVRFELGLCEHDQIVAAPVEAMRKLAAFITESAKQALASNEYVLTVATKREGDTVDVLCGDASLSFPPTSA